MISFLYQHSAGGLNYAKAEYLCSENSDGTWVIQHRQWLHF